MRDTIVLGERAGDVADEMLGLDVSVHPDRTVTLSGRLRMDGPLMRAIYRAEAELLLAEADAMATERYELRTPDQRRAAAFVLVAERLGEAATGMTNQNGAGHDRRGRRAADNGRRSA